MGGETEPTHPSTVHPPLYQKTTPISNTAEETTTPPLIPTTRPSRLPLRNPRPTSHPTGQETREQERTPRQQPDLRARHSLSDGPESPHPYVDTSTTPKTPQRGSHVLPEGTQHPSTPVADRSALHPRVAPCPVASTPKQAPNQPTALNQQLTPTRHPCTAPTKTPRTRPHVARNPTLNQSCARAQGRGQQHKTLKGDKRPHSTVSTTNPQESTSRLERAPRPRVQTRRARTSHEQPAPDPTDKTTTTRGRPKAPHQNTSDSRTHPCTPSLHTRQQKQEVTDASGNEKESMKNHRVTHASPPCITRSLFHMVYVQTPPYLHNQPTQPISLAQRPSLTATTKTSHTTEAHPTPGQTGPRANR